MRFSPTRFDFILLSEHKSDGEAEHVLSAIEYEIVRTYVVVGVYCGEALRNVV